MCYQFCVSNFFHKGAFDFFRIDAINNLERSQSFVRVDGTVEKIDGVSMSSPVSNMNNGIFNIMPKLMLTEMTQV